MATQQHRISLPIGNKKVEDLLLWRDPRKSGAAFAAVTVAYLILEWSNFNLLTVLANTSLLAIVVAFLWNNIASFTGRGGVPVPALLRQGITEQQARGAAEQGRTVLNKLLAFANRLLTGKEVVLTVQAAVALYVIGKTGGWFTTVGLIYTLVFLAFTVPKVYELKKDEIDGLLRKAHKETTTHYNKYVDPYVKKIPRASNSTTKSAQDSLKDTYTEVSSAAANGVGNGIPEKKAL
ncbi:hypothetical protein WJX72_008236 [[Myrmecia] bisecta]|uniref:Reticulon-like protein n=1 Tax=[Myrmecia] bisecta TaxID=41462 RepID=A0AAW1R7B3_9CHLO